MAKLSRELMDFLLELSAGVHRHRLYPPHQASPHSTVGILLESLSRALENRPELTIRVAQDRLLIEGEATDIGNPVFRELSQRLTGHGLAALTFLPGAGRQEVEGLLLALSQDPEKGEPLGLHPKEVLLAWEHVRLSPVGYGGPGRTEGPELGEARGGRAMELWLGLARAALARKGLARAGISTDDSAKGIRAGDPDEEPDGTFVDYLCRMIDELAGATGPEAGAIRGQVENLISELDEGILVQLMEMASDRGERRRLLLNASECLGFRAMERLLTAATPLGQEPLSVSLTRLLEKIFARASIGIEERRAGPIGARKASVDALARSWGMEESGSSTRILDDFGRSEALNRLSRGKKVDGPSGSLRVVQMSSELDCWAPTVARAATDQLDHGATDVLLRLLGNSPAGSIVGEKLTGLLLSPGRLPFFLADDEAAEKLIAEAGSRLGPEAIPALMDVLADSESRVVRWRAFDSLIRLGPSIEEELVARLTEPEWYVARNMLALARRLPNLPRSLDLKEFLDHEDVRVRREAFPLAVADPEMRELVLAEGLVDPDSRIVRMALTEIQAEIPESLVPVVVKRIIKESRRSEFRAMGIRALSGSSSSLSLHTLLEVCGAEKSLLGRRRAPDASPEVLAALAVLAERWRKDDRAREVVAAAERSKDPAIRRAVTLKAEGT